MGDEELLHRWRNDARGNLYCAFKYGYLLSNEVFKMEVKGQIESKEVFPKEKMFIICKKENLAPIGDISYRNWDYRNRSVEFGMEIGEIGERSKGYGLDALTHFIDYLFDFLNLHRIELTTLSDNKRAINLYEKLGFNTIGFIREASFDSRTGRYIDVVYMDLLKREWDILRNNQNEKNFQRRSSVTVIK